MMIMSENRLTAGAIKCDSQGCRAPTLFERLTRERLEILG